MPPSAPGAPPPSPRAEVTPGKLKALQQAISQGLKVTFKNGATITPTKEGGVVVDRHPWWPVCKFERNFGIRNLEAAYDYALNGETEEEKARRRKRKPFWFDPDKLRPDRPEWEECPF